MKKKKGIVDGQIEAAERKRWLIQRMNQQSQHVIPKKLNKEKFLASRENDVVSVLTQIVSGLNARGAIYWFVANFMKIVWKLSKTCFPPWLEGVMMWHVSHFFSEFSNFQRIRNLSKKGFPPRLEGVMMQHVSNSFSWFCNFQQSKVRQKKVFRLDLRGWWCDMLLTLFLKINKKNMYFGISGNSLLGISFQLLSLISQSSPFPILTSPCA